MTKTHAGIGYNTITHGCLRYYLQLTLVMRINVLAKINSRIKYKVFLTETNPNIKDLTWKIQFMHWHPANPSPFRGE